MIALRKLEGLPTKGRLKKCAELMRAFEEQIHLGLKVDSFYLSGLCRIIDQSDTHEYLRQQAGKLEQEVRKEKLSLAWAAPAVCGRSCGVLAALLLEELGTPLAEWDLRVPETRTLDPHARHIRPVSLYLENLRSPFNVGSIFRSADAFGISHIYLSPATPAPDQPRAVRSAMGTTEIIPWSVCALEDAVEAVHAAAMSEGRKCTVIALETGGTPIKEVEFSPSGLLILGNEEWGVSESALEAADVRVSIPMGGAKASLNVGVAAGIAMQRWYETEA